MAESKDKKKIKGYKEFDPTKFINLEPRLDEATGSTAVVSFGRMNPITIGHEKLAMKVMDEARRRKAIPMIFLSHSQDSKKNPLSYDDKVMFAKRAFGSAVKESPAKTIIDIAKSLSGKIKNLVLVVGSDRVAEFETLLNKYNNKEFNFNSIEIVSAGGRDPDAEGVAGMSASKMREFAANNDLSKFTSGLPKNLKSISKEVMASVRKGMNMSEETDLELDEALNRVQRRKRAIAMRRARFKIRRGKIRAERKAATLEVLKKRARKAALKMLKNKFAKGRNYAELSSGEKEVIDKRIERISKKRIEAIARKLLKKEKEIDIARRKSMAAGPKKEDVNEAFELFLNEASCADTKVRQKPHMLLTKEGKVKFDGRFKLYKKKVNESVDDLSAELTDLMESTEAFAEDYYKGVPKDKKDDRKAHFKRYAEKPGDGADKDSNYKPAPGDFKDGERVKTKVSKHTKKYHDMYGEEMEISEDATASLKKKAEKTGMPLGILRKVYNRGVAAWKSGHRPGTTPEQWGHARVNSFVTKSSGTWGKADSDLAAKVRKEEVELDEAKFKVKVPDMPKVYVDGKSAGEVRKALRKIVKPDVLTDVEIERVQPTEIKKDLRARVASKDSAVSEGLDELSMSVKDITKSGNEKMIRAMKKDKLKKDLADMRNRLNKNEEHGAGDEGTDKLVNKYKKDTPSA